jgi:hypothetical protein
VLLASAQHAKRNADVVLKKELHRFVSEFAAIARASPRRLTLVVLSGDEDFLESMQASATDPRTVSDG